MASSKLVWKCNSFSFLTPLVGLTRIDEMLLVGFIRRQKYPELRPSRTIYSFSRRLGDQCAVYHRRLKVISF
jgi:hypothetical protein